MLKVYHQKKVFKRIDPKNYKADEKIKTIIKLFNRLENN